MFRSLFVGALLIVASAFAAEPFYMWVEAESFGAWTRVTKPECSGGAFVAGNVNSPFCGDYIMLPEEGKFRVWVRYCEAQVGSRRGQVTVSTSRPDAPRRPDTPVGHDTPRRPDAPRRPDTPVGHEVKSPVLGGKGGGAWLWYDVGQFEGNEAVVELTGIDAYPAEVFFDCLLITSDLDYHPPDELPVSGSFDHKAFRAPWIPRVALLYMDYEYAGYTPRDEWDADLNGLGWYFDKYEIKQAEDLWARIGDYDILLMAALTTALDDGFMTAGAARLKAWLEAGGLLVYTDANYPEHIGWLEDLGLGGLAVETGGNGRPRDFGFRRPRDLFTTDWNGRDEDRPFIYCRHHKPDFPSVKWRFLKLAEPAWATFASGDAGALGAGRRLGHGLAVVSCLFKGLGLNAGALQRMRLGALALSGRPFNPRAGLLWGVFPRPPAIGEVWSDSGGTQRVVDMHPRGMTVTDQPSGTRAERWFAPASVFVPGPHNYTLYTRPVGASGPTQTMRLRATTPAPIEFRDGLQECYRPDGELRNFLVIHFLDYLGRYECSASLYQAAPDATPERCTTVGPPLRTVPDVMFGTDHLMYAGVPLDGLTPGRYVVQFAARAALHPALNKILTPPLYGDSGITFDEFSLEDRRLIEVVPPPQEPVPDINYDLGGISIDGKYFFPFGFFAVHKDSLPILAENGFSATCGGGGQEFLDTAWENGMRVFGSCSWDLDELKWNTSRFREHPALMGYYVMDEPSNSGHTIAQLHEMNEIIEDRDPMRPKFFIDNDPLEFPSCIPEVDIIMLDPYCIDGPEASLQRIVRDMNYAQDISRKGRRGEKPVFVILQVHPYGGGVLTKPTPEQIRAETYLAITEGARGVFYFLFEEIDGLNGIHNPDGTFEEPQWQEMKRIAQELPGLHDALHAKHISLKTSDPRIRASLRKCPQENVIFAVNMTADEIDAEVQMGEDGTPPLKLHFAPYGVHVVRGK